MSPYAKIINETHTLGHPENMGDGPGFDVIESIDSVLGLLEGEFTEPLASPHGRKVTRDSETSILGFVVESLRDARRMIYDQDRQLQEMTSRSDALARAQADAIVSSAEIIDELERTKHHLNEARTAAEAAAEDTQRLADTIFERTNDGVIVLENCRCITCNDNALMMFGTQHDDLVGKWPPAFMSAQNEKGDNISSAIKLLYADAVGGRVGSMEALLTEESGNSFWAEVTMSSFAMKGGGHVLVVVRDVTSRKQFEAELRRHSDFLDNIINAVPDPLSVKTFDQTLVVANDAFCRAIGVSRSEVVGKRTTELIDGETGLDVREVEKSLSLAANCDCTERRYRDLNGMERVASVKRSAFSDRDSGERYIVATSRDITEDRSREQQLQLLASVFRGASEGAAILTAEGLILKANPAFAKMTGVADAQALVDRQLCDVLPTPIADFDRVLRQVVEGSSWSGKVCLVDRKEVKCSYWVSLSSSAGTEGNDTGVIALISDITELENSQAELQRRALSDALTGLPNRTHFRDHLSRVIAQPGYRAAVCFLDLDDFKHVNDSAGHSAGDELLRQVAARISVSVPDGAFLARFGGDEFALIVSEEQCPPEAFDEMMENLLAKFREPFWVEQTQAVVGLSIGVCHYPEHACDVDTLMQCADIAMYVAKTAGKKRFRVFTSEMQDSVDLRHHVQSKLRSALSNGDLSLNFQPKVCAKTGRVVSCESLVRWRTEDGTYISPSQFIPIAELTGLIGPLGDLVFQKSAEQACRWAANGWTPAIAINVSAHQIRDPRFISGLVETLNETGAKAEWFELEITEHAMMEDVRLGMAVTEKLSALGFRIAIDDFGTGYSSLSYLKNFKIDTLKIDISFVRDVVHDTHSQAIVRSIISLGMGLGLSVVAEGVEEPEQRQLLTEYGCDVLQGYYFGHPVPAEEFSFK